MRGDASSRRATRRGGRLGRGGRLWRAVGQSGTVLLIWADARADLAFIDVRCRSKSCLYRRCACWLLGISTAVVRRDQSVQTLYECGLVTHAVCCVDTLTWVLVAVRARYEIRVRGSRSGRHWFLTEACTSGGGHTDSPTRSAITLDSGG
jgi:hypothetical protein